MSSKLSETENEGQKTALSVLQIGETMKWRTESTFK